MKTVSRRVLATLCIPLLFLMSSCMRMQMSYDIKSVDQINIEMNMGVEKKTAEQSNGEYTQDKMCQSVDEAGSPASGVTDVKSESYDDGTYIGCKVTGTASAANLSGDGTTISLTDGVWTFKLADSSPSDDVSPTQAKSVISDFKISVKFPGKVLTHNGSSTVSGTTVTWTDPADLFQNGGLQATAQDGGGNVVLFVVIGLVVLAAIGGGVAFFVISKNKKKAQQNAQFGGPGFGGPGFPGGAPGQQWGPGQPGGPTQPGGPAQQGWGQPAPGQPDAPAQQGWGAAAGQPAAQPGWGQPDPAQPAAPAQQGWGQPDPAQPAAPAQPGWGQPDPAQPAAPAQQDWSQPAQPGSQPSANPGFQPSADPWSGSSGQPGFGNQQPPQPGSQPSANPWGQNPPHP